MLLHHVSENTQITTQTHYITEILSERLIEEHKRKQCIKCKCLGYMQLRAISFIGQAYPKAHPWLHLTKE